MLETGEIDAWVGPLPPDCLERGAPGSSGASLREVERSYASDKPYAVVMRRQIHEEDPGKQTRLVELSMEGRSELPE